MQNDLNVENFQNPKERDAHHYRSLLDSLRQGGYILYARHAEATVGTDQPNLNFFDCSTQRNLSNRGRTQAATYGAILSRLRIPLINPVITSPFCRNRETAEIAFGRQFVQVDPFLVQIYNLSQPQNQEQLVRTLYALRLMLEVPPPPGRNKVIIAHSFPTGVGLGDISNMGTVIVRPLGFGNGFEVIGKLSLIQLFRLSD
ncbi:histidine phosphatase family protein [Anaerobacillus sp. MEB173]|uniref:histidine phosphatase family protein n=1 Tax=Anaerobacillus sp. MEB173 TaxID=3383345 RepID=UPI003F925783